MKLNTNFYVSAILVQLSKLKSKEFKANRYSARFKDLEKQVQAEKRSSMKRRIDDAVSKSNGTAAWVKKVASIINPEEHQQRDVFVLPEHAEQGLTSFQQAQDYAAHISAISREYRPLSRATLPSRVLHALDNAVCSGHPSIEDHEVFKNLSERKLTSGVKGDLHLVKNH